jgi:hypothetical protein
VHRDARNLVLSLRDVLNHPEALILLVGGARFSAKDWRHTAFWLPPAALGLAIWGIYRLVNIEERYVTLAYLIVILPVFAALQKPAEPDERETPPRPVAAALVVLLAFLALGESLRVALEERRSESAAGLPSAWCSPPIYGVAKSLNALGGAPATRSPAWARSPASTIPTGCGWPMCVYSPRSTTPTQSTCSRSSRA